MINQTSKESFIRQAALVGLFILGGHLLSAGGFTALVAMSLRTDPNPPTPLSNAAEMLSWACFPLLVLPGALLWVLVAMLYSGGTRA